MVANNTVGYLTQFPTMTVRSTSETVGVNAPTAPSALTAALATGPRVTLTWKDNASNETGFVVQRSADNGATFTQVGTAPAKGGSGSSVTYADSTVTVGSTYQYRVLSTNVGGNSAPSNVVAIEVAVPVAPTLLTATAARQGNGERVTVRWRDVNNESSYDVQWSTISAFTVVAGTGTTAANVPTLVSPTVARQVWFFRVRAVNALGASAYSAPVQVAAAP